MARSAGVDARADARIGQDTPKAVTISEVRMPLIEAGSSAARRRIDRGRRGNAAEGLIHRPDTWHEDALRAGGAMGMPAPTRSAIPIASRKPRRDHLATTEISSPSLVLRQGMHRSDTLPLPHSHKTNRVANSRNQEP